jgi:hypothetical protein
MKRLHSNRPPVLPLSGTSAFAELRYVWIFRCPGRPALHVATLDRRAERLPARVCKDENWVLSGQLIIGPLSDDSVGVDITALKAGIEQDGFYMWSADAAPLSTTLRLMR